MGRAGTRLSLYCSGGGGGGGTWPPLYGPVGRPGMLPKGRDGSTPTAVYQRANRLAPRGRRRHGDGNGQLNMQAHPPVAQWAGRVAQQGNKYERADFIRSILFYKSFPERKKKNSRMSRKDGTEYNTVVRTTVATGYCTSTSSRELAATAHTYTLANDKLHTSTALCSTILCADHGRHMSTR